MKHVSSILVILLFSLTSFSQKKFPGYIVKNNGDTIRGLIKRTGPFNDKPALIIYDSSKKGQKIMVTEVQGFGWIKDGGQEDYTKFKTQYSIMRYELLKIIARGKISVFEMVAWKGNNQRLIFYFKTLDGQVYDLDFSDYFNKKNFLRDLLADCPAVIEKIKGYLTPEKVLKFVDEYNNCDPNKGN